MKAQINFEPGFWIGVQYNHDYYSDRHLIKLCVIPCFPILFSADSSRYNWFVAYKTHNMRLSRLVAIASGARRFYPDTIGFDSSESACHFFWLMRAWGLMPDVATEDAIDDIPF